MFLPVAMSAISLLFVSCSSEDDVKDSQDELIERMWDYSQSNPDGFTIDVISFACPKEGIVVSYEATQNSFGKESLRKVLDHALGHAHLVGGWLDKSQNKYYFDSDTIFQESMLNEALEWGRKNKQLAVFVLSEQKEIPIEY